MNMGTQESYFDGGLLQLIGWNLLGAIITFLTFGICYPWALCMVYGWEIKHTVVDNWIKWLLLCLVTCGIYSFWLSIALKKWKVKHTEFAD